VLPVHLTLSSFRRAQEPSRSASAKTASAAAAAAPTSTTTTSPATTRSRSRPPAGSTARRASSRTSRAPATARARSTATATGTRAGWQSTAGSCGRRCRCSSPLRRCSSNSSSSLYCQGVRSCLYDALFFFLVRFFLFTCLFARQYNTICSTRLLFTGYLIYDTILYSSRFTMFVNSSPWENTFDNTYAFAMFAHYAPN
jgi:hypothetical protein